MRNIVFALVITLTLSFSATFDEAEIEYQKGNFDKAFSLFEKLSIQGNSMAQQRFGSMYYMGHGVKKDYEKSSYWFEKSANQGNMAGEYFMAYNYEKGIGVKQDIDKAIDLYSKSAIKGNPLALHRVSQLPQELSNKATEHFENGDYSIALDLFEKAALLQHRDSQYNAGMMYYKGYGVTKDNVLASYWLEKAANQGDNEAKELLKDINQLNIKEAKKISAKLQEDSSKTEENKLLYKKACDGGDVKGCFNLGTLYEKGEGVEKDFSKAIQLYKKACDGGVANGCANLGVFYEKGIGLTQNFSKSNELYKKACDGGDAQGCANIGLLYCNGKGVTQDFSKASQLLKKACDGGNANGCYNLGVLYANGEGVAKDLSKAIQLYKKACDGGDAKGCNNLGVSYVNGRGVERDLPKAKELYKRACNNGSKSACDNFKSLN